MTQNQIRYLQYQEDQRSNLAKEAETNRSNLENERLNREKLEYDKYGNSKIGGVVRTIKGIGDDVGISDAVTGLQNSVSAVVTGSTTNALGEEIPTSLNPKKDTSMVQHTEGNEVSGFDYKSGIRAEANKLSRKSDGELMIMGRNQLREEWKRAQKAGDTDYANHIMALMNPLRSK